MAIPLSNLKVGRYVRVEDLGGSPLKLQEVAARTALGLPKGPGIYVDLRDSRLNFDDPDKSKLESTVLSALIYVGTEVSQVGRYVRVEDLGGSPLKLQEVAARTPLGLPKGPGIYVDLRDSRLNVSCLPTDDSAVLKNLIFVGTKVTEVGRYALASIAWRAISTPPHITWGGTHTRFRAHPTSPGVYINFSHPTLSNCLSSSLSKEHFGFIFVEAAMLESLTVVGSQCSKLGRFARLDQACPGVPPKLEIAEENLMEVIVQTTLSHLPTAGGTYVDLAAAQIFETLKEGSKRIRKHFAPPTEKEEEDRVRRVEDAVIAASFLVPDKRLFLVARWLKERDWMLGRLRDDELRYLLEWVGTARMPQCKRIGCPCGHRLTLPQPPRKRWWCGNTLPRCYF